MVAADIELLCCRFRHDTTVVLFSTGHYSNAVRDINNLNSQLPMAYFSVHFNEESSPQIHIFSVMCCLVPVCQCGGGGRSIYCE